MKLKATAIKDVIIRTSVRSTKTRIIGDISTQVPSSKWEWLNINAGDSVDVGLVIGIHPSSLPQETPSLMNGVKVIQLSSVTPDTLPNIFFEIMKLEMREE